MVGFEPSPKCLLVKKYSFELKTESGIVYPKNYGYSKARRIVGEVKAVGKDVVDIEVGDSVVFNALAGMELVGSDHFDVDDRGIATYSSATPSEMRDYCVINAEECLATIKDCNPEKIY